MSGEPSPPCHASRGIPGRMGRPPVIREQVGGEATSRGLGKTPVKTPGGWAGRPGSRAGMLKIVEPLGGFADLYKKGPPGGRMASGSPVVDATRFRDDGWVV